jgi:hypothetical protein
MIWKYPRHCFRATKKPGLNVSILKKIAIPCLTPQVYTPQSGNPALSLLFTQRGIDFIIPICYLTARVIPKSDRQKPIFMISNTDEHKPSYHPLALEIGREYLLRVRNRNWSEPDYFPVKFVGYTSCPGVVIVSNGFGGFQRVSRMDIFNRGWK